MPDFFRNAWILNSRADFAAKWMEFIERIEPQMQKCRRTLQKKLLPIWIISCEQDLYHLKLLIISWK